MAKLLLAVFLLVFGCKLKPEIAIPDNNAPVAKHAFWLEEIEKTEKAKKDHNGPEAKTDFHVQPGPEVSECQATNLKAASFAYVKPCSGFPIGLFTPPDLP